MENSTNKTFTDIITENKQDNKVIYEKNDNDAAEEIDTRIEDTTKNT